MKFPFLLAFALLTTAAHADDALACPGERTVLNLDGKWAYIVDPYDTGYLDYRGQPYDARTPAIGGYFLDKTPTSNADLVEYAFDDRLSLTVPRDWNTQSDKLFYYEGSLWYRRRFDAPHRQPGERYFLQFEAVNYASDVYLNGRKLGVHVGGFTPFAYDVTSDLRDEGNSLVLRVNNVRRPEGVPTTNTDWWNYGGITRDVRLLRVPATFIANFEMRLNQADAGVLHVAVDLNGPDRQQAVQVSIPELGFTQSLAPDASGHAAQDFPAPRLERWSPAHPKLYQVVLKAAHDELGDRVGFRTITTQGDKILLNGEPIFLRGICIHEENPLRGGRASTVEDARMLLTWVKELHGNFARLAHYPHSENMARLADEMGILLWEETPVYWTIHWDDPNTLALARQQLREVIERDHNRASVIVWSVANETPVSDARTRFLKQLVDDARHLDGTRLVSAAMEVRRDPANPLARIVDDPFSEYTDLLSFNEYVGWYDGLPELCGKVEWHVKPGKPVVISEFGADALAGNHGSDQARFTEEFQARLYRENLAMLMKIPGMSGINPWILADFRSPRRPLPGIQDGWNRKGLIGDNGQKKEAFFVLRNFYDSLATK